jgi:hypothetical protein
MKLKHVLGSFSLLAAGLISSAPASTIHLNDNFDGYANQAAFQAAWPAIAGTAPQSAELSTAQAVSAPNSIRVPGTATTGQSRNRRSFADTNALVVGNEKLVWSFDFYDSSPTTSPARNYSNLQDTTAPSLTNQLIAMGFNNNQSNSNSGGAYYMARILGYTVTTSADPDGGPAEAGTLGSGAFFKLNDFGVGLRSLGWHNLKVEISTDDGIATDYAFFVDGILAEKVSNVGTVLRQYDNITLGSGVSNASTEAFFDNVLLYTVPEPSSLVLVSLLGLTLAGQRSRR